MGTKFPANVRLWISLNKDRLSNPDSVIDVVDAINDDFNLRDYQKDALTKDMMPEYNNIKVSRRRIAIAVGVIFIGILVILGVFRWYGAF